MRAIGSLIVLGFCVIVGITLTFGSWFTIDQTERGVLLRNGSFEEVVEPGLHFKLPWIESVYKLNMETHTKTFGSDQQTGKDFMEAYSADQQPATLRVSVTFHVAPDKVPDMYSRFGGDFD